LFNKSKAKVEIVKRLIEFPSEQGGYILVEVDEPEVKGGMKRVSRDSNVPEKVQFTFQKAMNTIKPVAESLIGKIHELSVPADEVEVKFGIKLTAEAGAFIASASTEGNLEVTITWKRENLNTSAASSTSTT
jgi:hypothetical protein